MGFLLINNWARIKKVSGIMKQFDFFLLKQYALLIKKAN